MSLRGIKILGFGLVNVSKNRWNYRHHICNGLEIPVLCLSFFLSDSPTSPSFWHRHHHHLHRHRHHCYRYHYVRESWHMNCMKRWENFVCCHVIQVKGSFRYSLWRRFNDLIRVFCAISFILCVRHDAILLCYPLPLTSLNFPPAFNTH